MVVSPQHAYLPHDGQITGLAAMTSKVPRSREGDVRTSVGLIKENISA